MNVAKALAKIAVMLAMFAGCGGDGVRAVFPFAGGTSGSTVPTGGVGGNQTAATGANVLDVIVDSGPAGLDISDTDVLFATATICAPGTSTCQTIDHLVVDTGAVGVRVLESVLTLSLPDVKNAGGQNLAECLSFVDGSSAWGPLKTADVRLGGETATGLTVQVIGDKSFAIPASCTGTALTDVQTLGANGFLGVGILLQDCGAACALSARSLSNPGNYYTCSSASACAVASVPQSQQVSHPVAAFPVDNNGFIIQLPSISASGAASVQGQLIFGIGTQDNNGLGSATQIPLDANGYGSTTFPVGGTAYGSVIDSGSNAYFFLDSATTKLPMCTGGLKDFYCPSSTTSLSATMAAMSGGDLRVDFRVANLSRLPASSNALDDVAGPMVGSGSDPSVPAFDWGLPFFFGRAVYIAIEGKSTPAGTGPYVAF
jgi:hypothetical protein